jgi:hypothetical protein
VERGAAKSKKERGRIFCPEVQGEDTGGEQLEAGEALLPEKRPQK